MKNIVSWGSGGCAYREGERVSLCRDWETVGPAPKDGNGKKITCVKCLKEMMR